MAQIDDKPEIAERAAELVLSRLPIHVVEATGDLADWQVAGPAMVVRTAFTLRALHRIRPQDSTPPAEPVARSLIEQAKAA